MTSFPPNFIPIVDAFDKAVDRLSPQIAGRAENPKDLTQAELIDFEDELGEFFQRKDAAERPVERLFRDALADGHVKAWGKNPATGLMEELIAAVSGREAWRQMAVGIPGFELRTHHLTNPGPSEEAGLYRAWAVRSLDWNGGEATWNRGEARGACRGDLPSSSRPAGGGRLGSG